MRNLIITRRASRTFSYDLKRSTIYALENYGVNKKNIFISFIRDIVKENFDYIYGMVEEKGTLIHGVFVFRKDEDNKNILDVFTQEHELNKECVFIDTGFNQRSLTPSILSINATIPHEFLKVLFDYDSFIKGYK